MFALVFLRAMAISSGPFGPFTARYLEAHVFPRKLFANLEMDLARYDLARLELLFAQFQMHLSIVLLSSRILIAHYYYYILYIYSL